MMKCRTTLVCGTSLLLAASCVLAWWAFRPAEEPQIAISQVWSPPANARATGVVYLKIDNSGGADRLLSASATVCRYVRFGKTDFSVHAPTSHGEDFGEGYGSLNSIEIPGKASVEFQPDDYSLEGNAEFQPDGYSIELNSLTKSLAPGETFAVTLEFEKWGTMEVNSEVKGGCDYLQKRHPDKVMADYTEAIRLDPKDPYVYRGRGKGYAGQGKFDKAIADYNEAIRLHPKDPYAYRRRGLAYVCQGKFDKAIADYTEAIRLDPKSRLNPKTTCAYLARFNRAYAYCFKGEYDKAIADCNEAIQLYPDCLYFRGTIAYFKEAMRLDPDFAYGSYYSALLRLEAGEVDAYRSECTRMLERFGQTRAGHTAYLTAWACALSPDATADYSNAVALAERALESDPKSLHYLQTLGAILYRAGRLEQAVERLTAASEMMEGSNSPSLPAYTWYFLAMAHHATEQPDEAKKWLGRAVKHKDDTARFSWNRRLTLKLLREETEALLKSTDRIEVPKNAWKRRGRSEEVAEVAQEQVRDSAADPPEATRSDGKYGPIGLDHFGMAVAPHLVLYSDRFRHL